MEPSAPHSRNECSHDSNGAERDATESTDEPDVERSGTTPETTE